MCIDVKEYNPQFKKVYTFMEKHLNADTEQDWCVLIDDSYLSSTEFEKDMIFAVVREIERRYTERHQEQLNP